MKRFKTLGLVGASAALILGAAVGGPAAIAAVGGPTAVKTTAAPAGIDSIISGPAVEILPGQNGIASVTCATRATGGGGTTSAFDIFFTDSFPSSNKVWTVRGTNTGTTAQTLQAWAVCR